MSALAGFAFRASTAELPWQDLTNANTSVSIEHVRPVLNSTNRQQKIRWLLKAMSLTTNLQPVVPDLSTAFSKEKDDGVRKAILHAMDASGDAQITNLCLAVIPENDPDLVILAGHLLITRKEIQGVELISERMENYTADQQRTARLSVQRAAKVFGFAFALNRSVLPEGMNWKEESRALTMQWVEWWATNKSKYLTNSPAPARK